MAGGGATSHQTTVGHRSVTAAGEAVARGWPASANVNGSGASVVTSSTMRSSSRRGIHSAPPSRWCASPASNASACAWAAANSAVSTVVSAVLSRPATQVDTRCARDHVVDWRPVARVVPLALQPEGDARALPLDIRVPGPVAFAQRPFDAGKRIAPLGSTDARLQTACLRPPRARRTTPRTQPCPRARARRVPSGFPAQRSRA